MRNPNGQGKAGRRQAPASIYSGAKMGARSESVFRHVYWAYPTLPPPYYAAQA